MPQGHGWFAVPGGFQTDVAPAIAITGGPSVPSRSQVVLAARRKGAQ